MLRRDSLFSAALFLSTIATVHASVVINEIAWMGTAEDSTNEWIELYNNGPDAVALEGWSVVASDGSPSIFLSGTISAQEYFLIERTDDGSVPNVPADLVTTFGTGLSNTGERLRLIEEDGGVVDDVDGTDGWIIGGAESGNNTTKDTAQRTSSGWATGAPTPGVQNNGQEIAETGVDTSQTSTQASQKGGGGSSVKRAAPKPKMLGESPALMLSMEAPATAYVNQEISFAASSSGPGKSILNSLAYTWNFGDTYIATGKEPKHVFAYEGEYVVVVEAAFAKQRAFVRQEIEVLPVAFAIERIPGGDVKLYNNAAYEVDIGGFSLRSMKSFVFPKYTILKANGSLIIPKERIGNSGIVSLYDGKHVQVASAAAIAVEQNNRRHTAVSESATAPLDTEEAAASEPEETIIQIGKAETNVEERHSIFSRFLSSVARLFD